MKDKKNKKRKKEFKIETPMGITELTIQQR